MGCGEIKEITRTRLFDFLLCYGRLDYGVPRCHVLVLEGERVRLSAPRQHPVSTTSARVSVFHVLVLEGERVRVCVHAVQHACAHAEGALP